MQIPVFPLVLCSCTGATFLCGAFSGSKVGLAGLLHAPLAYIPPVHFLKFYNCVADASHVKQTKKNHTMGDLTHVTSVLD